MSITPLEQDQINAYVEKYLKMPTEQVPDADIKRAALQFAGTMPVYKKSLPLVATMQSPLACEIATELLRIINARCNGDPTPYTAGAYEIEGYVYQLQNTRSPKRDPDFRVFSRVYGIAGGEQGKNQMKLDLGFVIERIGAVQAVSTPPGSLDAVAVERHRSDAPVCREPRFIQQFIVDFMEVLKTAAPKLAESITEPTTVKDTASTPPTDQELAEAIYDLYCDWLANTKALAFSGYSTLYYLSWQAMYAYCEEHREVKYDQKIYVPFKDFVENVGYLVPLQDIWICSRKLHALRLDSQNRLHAEGRLAVEYGDGWGFYANTGVWLPPHIGRELPENWDPSWVLEASQADMRALLVAGIGPEKFIRGLGGDLKDSFTNTVIHSIRGKIEQCVELYEPDWTKFNPTNKFKVLRLTCPSTKKDHWHWVPQNVETARDAYRWFWHGTEPEEWVSEA